MKRIGIGAVLCLAFAIFISYGTRQALASPVTFNFSLTADWVSVPSSMGDGFDAFAPKKWTQS
jgi:hypothetical protein